jgi:hypothetical protein
MAEDLEAYLEELECELARRAVPRARIVEEIRGHVLDAAEAAERQGIPPDAAEYHAIERIGSARSLAVAFAAERSRRVQKVLFAVAVGLGLLIAYVDSRPTWDDTGISAGLVLLAAGMLGALGPQRPWLWALGVGVWIPLWGIVHGSNYGSLLALVVAFAGAYGGMLVRRVLLPTGATGP